MLGNIASTRTLIPLLFVLLYCPLVSAQTVVIPSTDRGFYTDSGNHYPTNDNYATGDSRNPSAIVADRDFHAITKVFG